MRQVSQSQEGELGPFLPQTPHVSHTCFTPPLPPRPPAPAVLLSAPSYLPPLQTLASPGHDAQEADGSSSPSGRSRGRAPGHLCVGVGHFLRGHLQVSENPEGFSVVWLRHCSLLPSPAAVAVLLPWPPGHVVVLSARGPSFRKLLPTEWQVFSFQATCNFSHSILLGVSSSFLKCRSLYQPQT